MEQGGKTANRNGRGLEMQIKALLLHRGYFELTAEQKKALSRSGEVLHTGNKWFTTQVQMEKNIYGSKCKSDFYAYDSLNHPDGIHIEAKWQSSAGSVDEKYVFTAESLNLFDGLKIIVLDGGGARQGAVRWLRKFASSKKNFKFFTLSEFIKWANSSL